jgi:polyphosphate kinase
VLNKSLNFAVELEGKDAFGRNSGIAIVQAPRVLPRVIRLPKEIAGAEYDFVFLSSVLHAHVGELFAGMKVADSYQFRVTRNSELFVDEEEVKDLRAALRGELPHRQFGDEVRLELTENCAPQIADFLLAQFNLGEEDLYRVDGPVNLVRLMNVPDWVGRPDLKFPVFRAALPAQLERKADTRNGDMLAAVREGDILLYHPFQSFQPVIAFLEQAAHDPSVAAIKMTVYRTGAESELMDILIAAARSGKEGNRGAGASRALRRGGQHQLGAAPGGGRRARRLRRGRAQDARQDADGRAAGGGQAAALRSSFYRQLPSEDHQALHLTGGYSPATRRSVPT